MYIYVCIFFPTEPCGLCVMPACLAWWACSLVVGWAGQLGVVVHCGRDCGLQPPVFMSIFPPLVTWKLKHYCEVFTFTGAHKCGWNWMIKLHMYGEIFLYKILFLKLQRHQKLK